MTLILIVFDQISKFVAVNSGLEIVRNKGIAFSIFSDINPIFIAIILICLYITCHCECQRSNPERDRHGLRPRDDMLYYVLIIAGGISNLIDRIRLGYVVDFIDLKIGSVFNLADVFITIGVLGVLYGYIRRR